MLTSTLIATAALGVAIFDRVILEREKIDLLELRQPVYRSGFIDIPMKFLSRVAKLKGARVEYWLRDNDNPTRVVTGKHRTLDMAYLGVNEEFLSFKSEYVQDGCWTLVVRITHGDCRWNPLYRLFPLQSTIKQHLIIQQGKTNGD